MAKPKLSKFQLDALHALVMNTMGEVQVFGEMCNNVALPSSAAPTAEDMRAVCVSLTALARDAAGAAVSLATVANIVERAGKGD